MSCSDAEALARETRGKFLEQIAPDSQFHRLFDHCEGLNFFAKDRHGRLLYVSQDSLNRFGMLHDWQIVGKTDWDLTPGRLAENFLADDAAIYRTRQPMLNRVELWINQRGIPDWYLTIKLPIFGRSGEVIGIMGALKSYEKHQQHIAPYLAIAKAVEFVGAHYGESFTVADLAGMTHLSVRQLERKFLEAFRMTPQQFVTHTRIQFACEALRGTHDSIGKIALATGFCDQSAFTRLFRKYLGLTPLQYRRKSQMSIAFPA